MVKVVFYLINEKNYEFNKEKISNSFLSKYKRILHIDLIKDPSRLESTYGSTNPNLFVISEVNNKKNKELYRSKSSSLVELSVALLKITSTKKYDLLIFGSFCGIAVFNNPYSCKRFFYYLSDHLQKKEIGLIGICKDNESSSKLISLIGDKVTTLTTVK